MSKNRNRNRRPNNSNLSVPARTSRTVLERFIGPVPPPNVLADYKDIDPKIPSIILEMAVKEQEHRHHIERKQIEVAEQKIQLQATVQQGDLKFGTRGQWLAFSLAIIFLAVLVFFGYLGLETAVCWGFVTGGFVVIFRFLAPRFLHTKEDKKDS